MRSNLDTAPSHVFLKFHFEKDEKGQPDKAKKLQANFLKEFFHHPLTISVIYNIGYLMYKDMGHLSLSGSFLALPVIKRQVPNIR